ncbi:hypothetical protein DACRYDRAFT_102761 [Dacryopinax primogenitus]|uniref:GIT Spa2 homology (SHD) domain-containing protein n=1 Tax=Dacryopinax primogenitus (strain DJM 731) TaxID=1858805 RepID=M5FTZ5_DACPD|nr:uncharacterized protein DACRYDRAFT_102761 [Dacryopinax primogenitus]EJT96676.1 hypothetical protein DACRYDRAFT_102761 [Dacryopinax primogenitus]
MAARGLNPPPSPSATAYSAASGLSAYQSQYRPPYSQQQQPPMPSMQGQMAMGGMGMQPMQSMNGMQMGMQGMQQGMGGMPMGMQPMQGMQSMQSMGMQQPAGGMQGPMSPTSPTSGQNSQANYEKFQGFHEQLRKFLASEDVKEVPGARADPRSKLVKLNEAQFMELSTDVHDECLRRNSPNPTPFLPLRSELHPKRNQARQKLATLSKTKFRDLASDIYFELGRRFPAFKGQDRPETPTSTYEDSLASQSQAYAATTHTTGSSSTTTAASLSIPPSQSDSASGSTRGTTPTSYSKLDDPYSQQRGPGYPLEDNQPRMRRRPSETGEALPRQSGESTRTTGADPSVWRRPSDRSAISAVSAADRRRPSVEQFAFRSNQTNAPGYQGSQQPGGTNGTGSQLPYESASFAPPPTSTATLGVVNPMKSTMAEEEIEVPYGRDDAEDRPGSSASASDERDPYRGERLLVDEEEEEEGNRSPILTGPSTATLREGGLSALAGGFGVREYENAPDKVARAGARGESDRVRVELPDDAGDDGDGDGDEASTASRGVSEFYDKMSFGRVSVASSGGVGHRKTGEREGVEVEKLRREYELKIATMNNRIQSLEAELSEVTRSRDGSVQQLQAVREETVKVRDLANDQASQVAQLKQDLEDVRAARDREAEDAAARAQQAEAELELVRESFEQFKFDHTNKQTEAGPLADALRSEVQQLVTELTELSERNEEMMHEKDSDASIIRDLNAQIKEWKRKYENAKTELRHMKATSTLSGPQTPKVSAAGGDGDMNHLPTSDTGAIADVHVTAFQSSIDTLLAAGRSSQPTSVLSAMKNVVTAVAAITEDVRAFEARPRRDKGPVDDDAVRALKDRASATLNNLVMASKNHGTSYGLSPVSLLDAAASHVSSTIVEMVRLLKIRRGTRNFLERAGSNKSIMSPLKDAPEQRFGRSSSAASAGRDGGSGAERNSGPSPIRTNSKRRSDSHNGLPTPDRSTPTNSSLQYLPLDSTQHRPPIPTMRDEEAVPTEGSDDAWAELKPYLEAQSESIVHHIQTVLSGIRSGAKASELNEGLTQIITIVSSIVAVCKDSLPTASARQGQELLRELSEHCNTLSEAQVIGGEVNKQMRQAMATASFGVAKALKELMKL